MDPHFWTLDRQFYGFMETGQFVFMRINSAGNTAQPLLEMQTEHTTVSFFIRPATAVTRLTFGVPETDNIFEV